MQYRIVGKLPWLLELYYPSLTFRLMPFDPEK